MWMVPVENTSKRLYFRPKYYVAERIRLVLAAIFCRAYYCLEHKEANNLVPLAVAVHWRGEGQRGAARNCEACGKSAAICKHTVLCNQANCEIKP